MDFINFENKKILVTGASSGIGRATAILLSQLNARVILNGRNEEELDKTLSCMEKNNKHMILPFDVNDYDNYEKIFDKCVEDGEKISGLVYLVGISQNVPLRIVNEESIDNIFNTNFKSFLLLTSMVSKRKYSEAISIVVISSILAHYPLPSTIIYAASKGAIEAAIMPMAIELAKKKGRINSVVSSYLKAETTKDTSEETIKMIENRSLLGLLNFEDIANAIVFLLSERASHITGRSLFVDGGLLG